MPLCASRAARRILQQVLHFAARILRHVPILGRTGSQLRRLPPQGEMSFSSGKTPTQFIACDNSNDFFVFGTACADIQSSGEFRRHVWTHKGGASDFFERTVALPLTRELMAGRPVGSEAPLFFIDLSF